MKILFTVLVVLIAVTLLYALLIRGRVNTKGIEKLQGWFYAHRGLHDKPFVAENSMTAFRRAVAKGYGAELDVHLLKDGGLAVIHDSTLKRTTGADGVVEDLTTAELKNYRLEGSQDTIPTLQEVLDLFQNEAPLIIELKSAGGNAPQLTAAVCKVLENYRGIYCIESFDPRCLIWLKKNRPDIIRGQLSQNFLKGTTKLGRRMDFALTYLLDNALTRPDFVAYKFADRKNLGNQICVHLWGMQGVSWTLTTQEQLEAALQEGLLPIFERFEPEYFPKAE